MTELKQIISNFKIDFEKLKERYNNDFLEIFNEKKDWLCNIEDKTELEENLPKRENIEKVVANLKNKDYLFNNSDIESLGIFTSSINHRIVKVSNWINNFKQGVTLDNNSTLDLPDLFNKIKLANKFSDLNYITNTNLKGHLPNLFSIIKHCQDPLNYPIYYKFPKNLAFEIFSIPKNYDQFCNFYKEKFPEEDRHLNFSVFWEVIAKNIIDEINENQIQLSKKESYFLKNNFFRDDHLQKINFLNNSLEPKSENNIRSICLWHVRAGEDSRLINEFLENGVLAIGWNALGDLSETFLESETEEEQYNNLKDLYKKTFPDSSITNQVKQIYQFIFEINVEDFALTYDPKIKTYHVFEVTSDYIYDPDLIEYHHLREVRKIGEVKRNSLSQDAKKKLEALTSVSDVSDILEEVKKLMTENIELINSELSHPLNQILYGPPGTGKTYHTINKAIQIINPTFDLDQERNKIKQEYDRLVNEGRIVFTTFHQSMSYEDFIEGIKPVEPKIEGQPVIYKIQNGIFKLICCSVFPFKIGETIGSYEVISITKEVLTLKKPNGAYIPFTFSLLYKLLRYLDDKEIRVEDFKGKIDSNEIDKNSYPELESYIINGYPNIIPDILKKIRNFKPNNDKVVLIIDEINRGNVSQIFGELITLIEEDKRLGKAESLEITLPYSKEKFGVPSNLYIIGTMNTADRSVEALDTALRRRFSFEEMPPTYDLPQLETVVSGFKLSDILKTINKRIEKLLNKDHLIGHSFFIKVDSIESLQESFYKNIIPLLQEYFFGDYGKIGLVLGDGFVVKVDSDDDIFSGFSYIDSDSLSEKDIYEIIDYRSKKYVMGSFEQAIKTMMPKA